ncbi:MAG: ABC-2 family transporter protein [Akkermansiaceae bacterium]|nr:ABC-2 family transporter protein [Armatimonadota bacterium]
MLTNLHRYIRLYRVFARNNLVRELEFRANFWAKVMTNVGWLVSFVLFIEIIFTNTDSVGTWNKGQVFLLFGTFLLVRSLMDIFFTQNLGKIPELVRMGTMDFVLTKPVPSLFYVSARYLSLDELGSLIGAFGVLGYSVWLLNLSPSPLQMGAWMVLVLLGLITLYSIQLLMMTLSFWLIRIDNISALTDTVVFIARYPPDIFPRLLGFFISYMVPLAFVAAVPASVLLGKRAIGPALLLSFGVTAVFLTLANAFWRYATRAYTSASS